MRLTKNNPNLKRENEIRNRNKNISRDLKQFNYSNQISDHGGIFLRKILKSNIGYNENNNKIKIDSNNLINVDENMQNIFSSEEKRQKAISYINSINDKRKEKYKKLKLDKNKYNPYNYRNYITERDEINDSKSRENIYKDMEIEVSNYDDNYRKMKNKTIIENNSKNNFYNPQISMDYLNQSEQNRNFNENSFIPNSFSIEENNINKTNDKIKSFNRKIEFFRKLNNNAPNIKSSFNDKNIIPKDLSPNSSSSKKHYSPFKEFLSKSSYNFYINKVSNINSNEPEYPSNFTIRHFNNKNSLTSRNTEKEELKKKNNKEMNSLNYGNNIIYRNKKILNQKLFQTYSLKNNTSRDKKNYISINSDFLNNRYENDDEKENNENIESKFNINENEEKKEEKIKNFNINKEELKKYLDYFIKDITPININQFVIYSHSNNNYKNDENIQKNEENSDIFSVNKSCISLNKSQEFNKKIVKNDSNLNNSTYIQEFNNLKLKKNFFDISKHNTINSINKIHVKKRPINENIITHHNFIENKNSGFYICKKNKGENILDLPINENNLNLINRFLKESGFQISQIKSNKFAQKENKNQKKISDLNFDKEESNKKKKYNTNIEIRKFSNKKEKIKIIPESNKTNKFKNIDNKKSKNFPIKLNKNIQKNDFKTGVNLKNSQNTNQIHERIVVKLNENIEELEKNYENENNRNYYKKEDEIPKIIKVTTPYFRFNENNCGK